MRGISFDRFKSVAKRARTHVQKKHAKAIAVQSARLATSTNPLFNPFKDTRRIIRPPGDTTVSGEDANARVTSDKKNKLHKTRTYREVLLQGKTQLLPASNALGSSAADACDYNGVKPKKRSRSFDASELAERYELRKRALQKQR